MKTYHMYHSESSNAESKLKEAEKQEEKQTGRTDPTFNMRMEDKYQRRSSVKKIEKMREKVRHQEHVFNLNSKSMFMAAAQYLQFVSTLETPPIC